MSLSDVDPTYGVVMLDRPGSPGSPRFVDDALFADPRRLRTAVAEGAPRPPERRQEEQLSYVRSGEGLIAAGCTLVTTNCSWSIRHQAAMRDSLGGVPIVTSVLLVLPMLLEVYDRIGVISIDPPELMAVIDEKFPEIDRSSLVVEGVRHLWPWSPQTQFENDSTDLSAAAFARPLISAGQALAAEGVGAVLLDCASFSTFASSVQTAAGIPTFGIGTVIRFLTGATEHQLMPSS